MNTPPRRRNRQTRSRNVGQRTTASMIESFGIEPDRNGVPISAKDPTNVRDPGNRHVLAQATHVANVLIVMHADDHGTGPRNSRALKKAWVIRRKMAAE